MNQISIENSTAAAPSNKNKKLSNLQVLRGFAAINVVLFHIIAWAGIQKIELDLLSNIAHWGRSGVDLFFVISGFVIVYIHDKKKRPAKTFYLNRIKRIIPLYWLITGLSVLLHIYVGGVFIWIYEQPEILVSSLLFCSQLVFDHKPTIVAGWTLEWEMYFYTLFAIGILVSKRISPPLFATVFICLSVIYFDARLIAFEFVLGMLAAHLYISGRLASYRYFILFTGISLYVASIFFTPEIDRLFLYGIPSFFIVLGAVQVNQCKPSILVKLGDASYSIYLSHHLSLSIFFYFWRENKTMFNNDILAFSCLLFAILFGYFIYVYIEKSTISRFISFIENRKFL